MKINFFSQHFLLYVSNITKVNGERKDYLVLIYDTPNRLDEVVMVGSIKISGTRLIIHTEVFL